MPGEDGCFVSSKERLLLATSFVCFACGTVIGRKAGVSLDSSAARFTRLLLLAAPHSAAVAVTFVAILTIAIVDEVSLHCIIPHLANCYLRVRSDTCFHLVIFAPFFLCWLLAICRGEKETATERIRTFCRAL